jgi:hypothetical protein
MASVFEHQLLYSGFTNFFYSVPQPLFILEVNCPYNYQGFHFFMIKSEQGGVFPNDDWGSKLTMVAFFIGICLLLN